MVAPRAVATSCAPRPCSPRSPAPACRARTRVPRPPLHAALAAPPCTLLSCTLLSCTLLSCTLRSFTLRSLTLRSFALLCAAGPVEREQHPRWEGAYWVRTAHAWYKLLEPDAAYVSLWNATDGARLRVRPAGRDVGPALGAAARERDRGWRLGGWQRG